MILLSDSQDLTIRCSFFGGLNETLDISIFDIKIFYREIAINLITRGINEVMLLQNLKKKRKNYTILIGFHNKIVQK